MDNPLYLSILFGFSLVLTIIGFFTAFFSFAEVFIEDNYLKYGYIIALAFCVFVFAIGVSGLKYYNLITGEAL